MKRVILYGNWLLLASGVLVLVVALLCLVMTIVFGEWNLGATLYWLTFSERFYDDLMLTIGWAFLIIGFSFVVLVGISRLLAYDSRYSKIGARAVFLPLIAGIIMYGTSVVRVFQTGPFSTWDQLQTVVQDNHVYHLLNFAYDETETHYYRFYECDHFDLFCQELYSKAPIGSGVKPSDERILLVADSSTKTISLQIYGEIVYTRHSQ